MTKKAEKKPRWPITKDIDGIMWSIDKGLKDGKHPVISDGNGDVVAVVYDCGLASPTMARARAVAASLKMLGVLQAIRHDMQHGGIITLPTAHKISTILGQVE